MKEYFMKYLNQLGDIITYNKENRIVEFIDEPYKIRFSIGWLRCSFRPDLLEIHMTLYNTTIPIKKSNIVRKAWIYKYGDEFEIQDY